MSSKQKFKESYSYQIQMHDLITDKQQETSEEQLCRSSSGKTDLTSGLRISIYIIFQCIMEKRKRNKY